MGLKVEIYRHVSAAERRFPGIFVSSRIPANGRNAGTDAHDASAPHQREGY